VSKASSFSRLALPIFRWTAMIIGALIGGVLGVFGFAHVISMDSWVYRYPVSCTVSGVIVAFMLSVAMYGTRRDNPRTWGNFEILAGCGLIWNAIAVAIHQGPQAQTEGAAHAAYVLKLLAGIFLMVEGHKDRERASHKQAETR
jgi:uncharacterized membrane protein